MSAKAAFPLAVMLCVLGACVARSDDAPGPKSTPATFPSGLPTGPLLGNEPASTTPSPEAAKLPAGPQSPILSGQKPTDFVGIQLPIQENKPATEGGAYTPRAGLEGQAQAQAPGGQPASGQEQAGTGPMEHAGLSSWITYTCPDCCGPMGGNGPIMAELYTRTGPTFTFGDGVLAHLLDHEVGWDVSAGGRSLFFNPAMDAAWTVDLGLTYIYNHSSPVPTVPLLTTTGTPAVLMTDRATVRNLSRTFVNAGLGGEWWLNTTADDCCGWKLRAGFDGGGRLGTAKSDIHTMLVENSPQRHLTDTIYGTFVALHADVEKPCCGCCTFMAGVRAEWDFTWMDILKQQNNSNVEDINLLVTFGVRF